MQGRAWNDKIIFNLFVVALGIGCGIGAFFSKKKSDRNTLLKAAAAMYILQFGESLLSTEWKFLNNKRVKAEALALLSSYKRLKPKVNYTIKNFHHIMKEVKKIKKVPAEADQR